MKSKIWYGLLAIGILLGLWNAYKVYSVGFTLYAKTDVLVWTLPLSTYIFFSLTSAGLAFVSSIPVVFGIRRYDIIEKRTVYLEISVLLGSFVCLILHLGSPLQVIYIFLSPNPSSPLWWLAMLYHVYFVVLLLAFWRIHTKTVSKALGVIIFLIAIGTSTTLGWLLGMTDARPTLNASFFSVYFPLTAFGSGIAAIILFSLVQGQLSDKASAETATELYDELARIMGLIAGVVLILFIWRTIIGGISSTAEEFRAFKHMIGSISYHIELWLGLVLPTVLMLLPAVRKSAWGKIAASFLFLVGMFAGRLEFVLSGVIRPLGQMAEGRPEFVSYMPTVYEFFVAIAGFSVILLIYTVGTKFFKLETAPKH
ncbi:MAG: polysulfide reductase NrfD [Deltaproteobacteria bacterium]|nr:polysulfide reductase NrfD [Deltaproteobacteria bacterium]